MPEYSSNSVRKDASEAWQQLTELSSRDLSVYRGIKTDPDKAIHLAVEKTITTWIASALRSPGWILDAQWSQEFLSPNHLTDVDKERISSISHMSDQKIFRIACDIQTRQNFAKNKLSYISEQDILMRTFDLMSQAMPGISFFRGTYLNQRDRYQGSDFYPGLLAQAIDIMDMRFPVNPVVVCAPLSGIVRAYKDEQVLHIGEEHPTWGSSLSIELMFREHTDLSAYEVGIRRIPKKRENILQMYTEMCYLI